MKDSYLTAGITLGRLVRLLRRNKVKITPKTLFRLAFLFQSACWSSIFSALEHARYGKALEKTSVPGDPVFIIGHWRTGSTFLHQLLNLDPDFHAPTLFEVAVPDSFLVSYPYYRPIFKRLVAEKRPMDQVKIGMDEPQEDEYAIYRTTNCSPLEKLVFQNSDGYFLNHGSPGMHGSTATADWKREVRRFFLKLHFRHRKRIISKNPFNSFRVNELIAIFPRAKFIHIIRHPYDVIPSTIHMWRIIGNQNRLTGNMPDPSVGEVATVLVRLLEEVDKAKAVLPAGIMAEIRFEDLEKDPLSAIRKIYEELNLSFSVDFESNINSFLTENNLYQKNDFTLAMQEKQVIREHLNEHMEKYHYC